MDLNWCKSSRGMTMDEVKQTRAHLQEMLYYIQYNQELDKIDAHLRRSIESAIELRLDYLCDVTTRDVVENKQRLRA